MGTITIVGLGPGAVGHLSLETMGLLQNCAQVILRTAVHPTVAELEKQNVKFTSCDDLYEKAASFEEVYNSVVERVLAAAQNGDVVYAVPGSPLVAEKTVVLMRTAAKAQGIKLVIKPSMSFLDLAYVELGIDPIAGLQIIDAQDFAEIASAGQHPLMITQVYSQMVAGDLKIALITLKYTQSNSVCYVKDGQAIGIGAGQQSRIHCTRLAGNKADIWWLRQHPKVMALPFKEGIHRADRDNAIDVYISEEHDDVLRDGAWQKVFTQKPEVLTMEEKKAWIAKNTNVVLGSDAFFPFGDNIDRAYKSGVKYVAQPGGSVRDDQVIETCDQYGMVMAFTGIRLFHH